MTGPYTGSTIIAAVKWIKAKGPSTILITSPVVPKGYLRLLENERIDQIEVITSPIDSNFKTVGQFYHNFEQITHAEVIEIIKRNRGKIDF